MDAELLDLLLSVQVVISVLLLLGLVIAGYVLLWRKKKQLEGRIHIMLDDIKGILQSHAALQDKSTDNHAIIQNQLNRSLEQMQQRYKEIYPDDIGIRFNSIASQESKTLVLRHEMLRAEKTFNTVSAQEQSQQAGEDLPSAQSQAWSGYRELVNTLIDAQMDRVAKPKRTWTKLRNSSTDFKQLAEFTEEQKEFIDELHNQLQKAKAGEISEAELRQYRHQVQHLLDGQAQSDSIVESVGNRLHNYELELERLEQEMEDLLEYQGIDTEEHPKASKVPTNVDCNGKPHAEPNTSNSSDKTPAMKTLAVSKGTPNERELELNQRIHSLVEENNELRERVERLGRFARAPDDEEPKASSG